MKQFVIVSLTLVLLVLAVVAVFLRDLRRRDPRMYFTTLGLIALVAVIQVLTYLPYETVAQQPAGKLVTVQLGTGLTNRMLVETDTAFYTVRGGFSAKRGEPLELQIKQHPLFKGTERYLCAADGCAELSN